jgi:hypothetical protein
MDCCAAPLLATTTTSGFSHRHQDDPDRPFPRLRHRRDDHERDHRPRRRRYGRRPQARDPVRDLSRRRRAIAKLPGAPNLAAQSAQYQDKQLRAFPAGERKEETMTIVTKDQTDADIANLVARYSSMEITVTVPS